MANITKELVETLKIYKEITEVYFTNENDYYFQSQVINGENYVNEKPVVEVVLVKNIVNEKPVVEVKPK